MSDKETARSDSKTDTLPELDEVQVWDAVLGQELGNTTTEDSDDDTPNAADDPDAQEHADKASSSAEDDGEGQSPAEQRTEPSTEVKRLRGQVSGKDKKLRELQQAIAAERKKRKELESKGADPQTLEDLRESFPDIVEPFLKENMDIRSRLDALDGSIDKMSELHEATLQNSFDDETAQFQELRPSGTKVVRENRNAFWNWVEDQPAKDRELAYASQDAIQDGVAMADLLNKFETHLSAGEAPNEPVPSGTKSNRGSTASSRARLSGAQTVASRGSQSAVSKPRAHETDDVAIWNSITK